MPILFQTGGLLLVSDFQHMMSKLVLSMSGHEGRWGTSAICMVMESLSLPQATGLFPQFHYPAL